LFLVLILATIVCWWHWVVPLLRLAYSNEQYSHVLLVLPVSVSFALLESRAKGVKPGLSSFPGLTMVLVALVLWLVAQSQMEVASETALAVGIAGLVVSWIGLVTLFFGVPAARQLLFPLLFLFLLVPTPRFLVDRCIVALQVASSEETNMLFRWAGVPVLKSGFVLSLPALDIEVAKQCSGIRSGLMLLISVLVLGHSYLRSNWGKALFVLAGNSDGGCQERGPNLHPLHARDARKPRLPRWPSSPQWRSRVFCRGVGRHGGSPQRFTES